MRLDNEILWIKHFRKPEIGRNLGMPITFLTRQNFLRIFKHIVPKRRFRLGTISLKILRIICGSRGKKICFRPVISSRSYLAIFIPNEISSICFVTSVSRRRLKIGKSRAFFNYITGGPKPPPAPMVAPPLNHFGPPSQSPFSLKYKQNMEFRREV